MDKWTDIYTFYLGDTNPEMPCTDREMFVWRAAIFGSPAKHH